LSKAFKASSSLGDVGDVGDVVVYVIDVRGSASLAVVEPAGGAKARVRRARSPMGSRRRQ
jgi:hypothetical protein